MWTLGIPGVDSRKSDDQKPAIRTTYPVDSRKTELILESLIFPTSTRFRESTLRSVQKPVSVKNSDLKQQKAMAEMDSNPQGMALLKAVNFKGMRKADDSDYNVMRKLNIQPIEAK